MVEIGDAVAREFAVQKLARRTQRLIQAMAFAHFLLTAPCVMPSSSATCRCGVS